MMIEARRTSATTTIGPIEITWGGDYWIAKGPVPLAVAHELYEHPLGRRAVRINGLGHCPPPQGDEVSWYTAEGARVWSSREEAEMQRLPPWITEPWHRLGPMVFHDRPTEIGAIAYVELYHIDGDEAFMLFESVLCKHGVEAAARPTWWERRFGVAGAASTVELASAPAPCDSDEADDYMAALREGTLDDDGITQLATHVQGCEACRVLVAYMIGETHKDAAFNIIRSIEHSRVAAEREKIADGSRRAARQAKNGA